MQDPLNAIRRLYGESGAEPPEALSPEAQAEADALAVLSTGLDALPSQRPDAATLESIFAAAGAFPAAGEDALAPIRAVYEDENASADARETAVIAELKAGLDALPRQRPEAATLDAVFAAAGAGAPVPPRAADRAPKRLITRRRTVVALSAAFALMLVFTSGLWFGQENDLPALATAEPEVLEERLADEEADADQQTPEPAAEQTAVLADAAPLPAGSREAVSGAVASVVPPPQVQASAPSAPPTASALPRPSIAQAETRARRSALSEGDASSEALTEEVLTEADLTDAVAMPEAATEAFAVGNLADGDFAGTADLALASDDALPLDDGDAALQTIYLRMQQLQTAQAGLGWDEPPVSLGAAPDSTPASQDWMKVRVER